jgi:hypothetical protein
MQWAILLTAQPVPILIYVVKDVFQTCTAQNILRPPSGDTLCRFAPEYNATVAITHVNTVV